ncbi:probable histone-lysine N-methyltransferase set-23 [Tribolium madens]|uniref:probable histone-lysine N-methyltransferase set-23 n=1 Tax=Tribolium madens TaxID=41895 RepID=UPI001CF7468D|nr:probable histone-lysine N-methyltransferase set-23 [Tribolium madens]
MEFWDNYDHDDPKLTYIVENIKSQEIEELISYEFLGCECDNMCTSGQCTCLQRSGANYVYSDISALKNYVISVTNENKPIYECNNNCKCCTKMCGNKLVQLGPRKNLKIVKTENKGLGLFSADIIDKGNFICEYAGEVITQAEAHRRFASYATMGLQHNYIFCINENFGSKNEKTFIDPTFYGNMGRYINHSCDPNSVLIPIRVDNLPKLCIFAKESINKNTEITFNYGQSSSNQNNKPCLCLSANCKGFMPYDGTV